MFHERNIKAFRNKRVSYSSDGLSENDSEIFDLMGIADAEDKAANDDSAAVAGAIPVHALMNAGDILIFDTKLFHFGGANISKNPRALLCLAFQSFEAGSKDINIVDGFTYHCHSSVKVSTCTYKFIFV